MKTFQIAVLAALTSMAMRGDVVYNNTSAIPDGADSVSIYGPLYDSFTPTSSGDLSGLSLALTDAVGIVAIPELKEAPQAADDVAVGLYSDDSIAPGNLIATLGTVDSNSVTDAFAIYTVNLLSNPTLTQGVRYWIGLSATDTPVNWAWSFDLSGPGVAGEYFSNNINGVASNLNGPYEMLLTTAPEPASILLIGGGLAAIALVRRRRA